MNRKHQPMTTRSSMGGDVVRNCLVASGFSPRAEVALVETAFPGSSPFDAVIAQNAWNLVPRSTLRDLLRDYPRRMHARFLARRALAFFNLERSRMIITLTTSAAEMCRARFPNAHVVVRPIYAPLDVFDWETPVEQLISAPFALVPGTVTWYKNPHLALKVFVRSLMHDNPGLSLVFAGSDDGSGTASKLREAARHLGANIQITSLTRAEMRWALRHAEHVILPSKLESLGFSVSEAIVAGARPTVSPIAAHVEIVTSLEGHVTWISDRSAGFVAPHAGHTSRGAPEGHKLTVHDLNNSWTRLADTLMGA